MLFYKRINNCIISIYCIILEPKFNKMLAFDFCFNLNPNVWLAPLVIFLSFFKPNLKKMLDIPLVIFFKFEPKFDKTAWLPHCDFISSEPKFEKNAGITPCDFHFFIQIVVVENAGLTPCDFLFIFEPRFDKINGLTPCDFFKFEPKNQNFRKMLDLPPCEIF